MDPALYYKTFRPYIRFFEGVVYEGRRLRRPELPRRDRCPEQRDSGRRRLSQGPASALDADRPSSRDAPVHARRASGTARADRASSRSSAARSTRRPYNEALEALAAFRETHLEFARRYIAAHVRDPRGTGGTPYLEWLSQLIDESRAAHDLMSRWIAVDRLAATVVGRHTTSRSGGVPLSTCGSERRYNPFRRISLTLPRATADVQPSSV